MNEFTKATSESSLPHTRVSIYETRFLGSLFRGSCNIEVENLRRMLTAYWNSVIYALSMGDYEFGIRGTEMEEAVRYGRSAFAEDLRLTVKFQDLFAGSDSLVKTPMVQVDGKNLPAFFAPKDRHGIGDSTSKAGLLANLLLLNSDPEMLESFYLSLLQGFSGGEWTDGRYIIDEQPAEDAILYDYPGLEEAVQLLQPRTRIYFERAVLGKGLPQVWINLSQDQLGVDGSIDWRDEDVLPIGIRRWRPNILASFSPWEHPHDVRHWWSTNFDRLWLPIDYSLKKGFYIDAADASFPTQIEFPADVLERYFVALKRFLDDPDLTPDTINPDEKFAMTAFVEALSRGVFKAFRRDLKWFSDEQLSIIDDLMSIISRQWDELDLSEEYLQTQEVTLSAASYWASKKMILPTWILTTGLWRIIESGELATTDQSVPLASITLRGRERNSRIGEIMSVQEFKHRVKQTGSSATRYSDEVVLVKRAA